MIRNRNAYSDQVLDEVIRIYVTVDETGNLGQNSRFEKEYVIVGCAVLDREQFENVSYVEALKKGREIKFNTDPELRERILLKAAPYVDNVYYIRYRKDKAIHNASTGLTADEKHDLHLAMLNALANAIFSDYEGTFYVDIDANSLIRNYEAIRSFEENAGIGSSTVKADVQESKYNYGLQTNDFFVGAVGQMVNGPGGDSQSIRESRRYVDLFKRKPKRVFFNRNRRRFQR